ncbi:MAG: hypothetical protein WDW36_005609 [Sanguina aurantia]
MQKFQGKKGKTLPSPPVHAILGHIPAVAKYIAKGEHLDNMIQDLTPSLGKIFELKLILNNFVVVTDPDLVKEVLVTRNMIKSPTYRVLFPFIGHRSILVSEKEVWHKQRRAFNPGFSFGFLKAMVPVFVSKSQLLLDKLGVAADSGEVVSFYDAVRLTTMDIICETAFSENFNFQTSDPPPELYTLFMELFTITAYFSQAPHLEWMRWLPWNVLKISGLQRKFDAILMGVIDRRVQHLASLAAGAVVGADSPGGLTPAPAPAPARKKPAAAAAAAAAAGKQAVAATARPGELEEAEYVGPIAGVVAKDILTLAIQTASAGGKSLDMQEILSQVKTFLFAGHDTTASTLACAVYELSTHPEIEAKMLAEIREVCGDRHPTADELGQMKYMTAIIKETLRLWPPGATARWADKGTILGGYDVGGKILYLPHWPGQRDPSLWGPTAEVFSPERFLDEEYMATVHPFAYQPFSKGPRDCIGQVFAMLEAKAVLILLYQHLSFSYAHSEPEVPAHKVTAYPRFGVPVKVTRRH